MFCAALSIVLVSAGILRPDGVSTQAGDGMWRQFALDGGKAGIDGGVPDGHKDVPAFLHPLPRVAGIPASG